MDEHAKIARIAKAMMEAGGAASKSADASDAICVCASVRLAVDACLETTGDMERAQNLLSVLVAHEFASQLNPEATIQ